MNYEIEKPIGIEYAKSHNWAYKLSGMELITTCPLCNKEEHFYMNVNNGLWDCKVCGQNGNITTLRKLLGDPIPGLVVMGESAVQQRPKELPNIAECYTRLMADQDALDYLVSTRGWKLEVIEKLRLGLWVTTKAKYIIYPYVNSGKYLYAKLRCIPPVPDGISKFMGSTGRENPLFNADVIDFPSDEIILVEGEGDCIALLSMGIENVAGVPGANMKKAIWIDRLDVWWDRRIEAGKQPKIYILYDADDVGQKAAEEIAKRIGIERCWLIKLPLFEKFDGGIGKDVNEWIRTHSNYDKAREEFEALKAAAAHVEIKGVYSLDTALGALEARLKNQGSLKPTYDFPWTSVNEIAGGAEPGDRVDIIAEGKIGKTTFGLNWLDYLVSVKNISSLLLCFEMQPERIARKWASFVTGTDDTPGKSAFTLDTIAAARTILTERTADFILGYTVAHDKDKILDLIRQAVRRYGIKVVMIDHLQQMIRSVQHAAQETSALSKAIKDLAMELGLLIVLIVQPKRVEANEIVAARHAAGSSAIEKDCDMMIALHRNRIGVIKASDFVGQVEEHENFGPYMLTRIDLSRYSPGGACTLYIEGAKSLVRELNPDEAKVRMDAAESIEGGKIPVEGENNEVKTDVAKTKFKEGEF
jgi:5S rRNA maturation endonuclease (ribonuclease M5)/KaiC/GvpD/RAD55 family RecA-like ATPase